MNNPLAERYSFWYVLVKGIICVEITAKNVPM
jgi:hypothetical protein